MHTNLMEHGHSLLDKRSAFRRCHEFVVGAVCLLALLISGHAKAAAPAAPAECKALQARYPQFKGKSLVNAINPHLSLIHI